MDLGRAFNHAESAVWHSTQARSIKSTRRVHSVCDVFCSSRLQQCPCPLTYGTQSRKKHARLRAPGCKGLNSGEMPLGVAIPNAEEMLRGCPRPYPIAWLDMRAGALHATWASNRALWQKPSRHSIRPQVTHRKRACATVATSCFPCWRPATTKRHKHDF